MAYRDTLQLYDELIAAGIPEAQARAQAKQLGEVAMEQNGMLNVLEKIEKDMYWMRIIGAAMTVTFFSNGFFMWLAK
jgi:hypothetical protein